MNPVSILLVWEDRYFEGLKATSRAVHRALRGNRQDIGPAPRLFDDTLGGYGGFRNHVQKDLGRLRKVGLPRFGKVDHVLYVIDADQTENLLRTLGLAQPEAGDTWLQSAEERLESVIRQNTTEPERAHVVLLRWAKETVFLAGHDQPAWSRLMPDGNLAAARSALYRDCSPDPSKVADHDFVETFRSWKKCIALVEKHLATGKIKKKDVRVDDVLKELSKADTQKLMARVPDLRRLGEKILDLSCP